MKKKLSKKLLSSSGTYSACHVPADTNGCLPKCASDAMANGRNCLAFPGYVIENSDQILNICFSYQGHPNH